MATDFQMHEAPGLRSVIETLTDRLRFHRVYNIPWWDSTLPARGDVVVLEDYPRDSLGALVTLTGFARVRVESVTRRPHNLSSPEQTAVTFYQPTLLTGGDTGELASSRTAWTAGNRRHARRVFVTTDGSTGLPAVAAAYLTDTGVTARKCLGSPDDIESMPGLHYHVVPYVGVVLRAGTTAEVAYTRKERSAGNRRYVHQQFVSTDGTTGVPVLGESFTGDSGITGRYCQDVTPDPESIPGLILSSVTFMGVVAFPSGSTGEIIGSRKAVDTLDGRHWTRAFVSTDGTTNVPTIGDAYPSDTGDTARKATAVRTDPEAIVGLYLHSIDYRGVRAYSA